MIIRIENKKTGEIKTFDDGKVCFYGDLIRFYKTPSSQVVIESGKVEDIVFDEGEITFKIYE